MCVVINPGKIKNNANSNPEDVISYILLLDSLKLHGKLNVLKNIRRWLNNVYEDKYTKKKIKIQKIKKKLNRVLCLMKFKYINQMVSDIFDLIHVTTNINLYHSLIFPTKRTPLIEFLYLTSYNSAST